MALLLKQMSVNSLLSSVIIIRPKKFCICNSAIHLFINKFLLNLLQKHFIRSKSTKLFNLTIKNVKLNSKIDFEMSLPTDFGPDSGGRVKGLVIVKPIVYGNIARYFGKKREEDGHTHQWTVYVKPYGNEDMSGYIKKVHFKLHESYANPNRIVTKPPYELTETGWGEFEIVIKLYFHDPNERPVTLYHILKLFQSPVSEGAPPAGRALVSESYEEIVFQEPTQLMQHLLNNLKPITNGTWSHDTDFEEKKEKTLERIISAQTKVRMEISELKEKLHLAKETISKFKDEIAKLQNNPASGILSGV